jgi:hypothetical protein
MGDREKPHTCLSDDSSHRVRHFEIHYFGCLREEDKAKYFKGLPKDDQKQIRATEANIQRVLRKIGQEDLGSCLIREIKELRGRFFHQHDTEDSPLANGNQKPTMATSSHLCQLESQVAEPSFYCDEDDHKYEMTASVIFLDPKSPQKFEEEKISVHNLGGTRNPLRVACPKGKFRYFHLPHNNMKWVMVRQSM